MIKVIYLFIILSLTGFITIWIKNDPGLIAIEWQGWLIETSAAIIISIIIIIFLTIVIIYKLLAKIFSIPKNIQKTFKENKTNRANKTIIKALSAKNMGEMELAEKLSLKAKYLNNDPLKLLLDSEISNYNGNEDIYIKKLNKMLDHPETMLLGIKNLSNLFIPIMFASNFGFFFVNSLNLIPIDLQSSFINISNNLILLSANGTLSSAPGASNFLCIDLAISISGEIITSIGRFSLLYTLVNLGFK